MSDRDDNRELANDEIIYCYSSDEGNSPRILSKINDYSEYDKFVTKLISDINSTNFVSESKITVVFHEEENESEFRVIANISENDGNVVCGFIVIRNKLGVFSQIRTCEIVHHFSDDAIHAILAIFFDDFEGLSDDTENCRSQDKRIVLKKVFETIPSKITDVIINKIGCNQVELCDSICGLLGLVSYVKYMQNC